MKDKFESKKNINLYDLKKIVINYLYEKIKNNKLLDEKDVKLFEIVYRNWRRIV